MLDFVDTYNKIIYEIKPKGMSIDKKVQEKRKSALKYCEENGYNYIEVDEMMFAKMLKSSNIEQFKLQMGVNFDKFIKGIGYDEENCWY